MSVDEPEAQYSSGVPTQDGRLRVLVADDQVVAVRGAVLYLGALDLDVEVPPGLYKALAEVLAHLYRANAKR